MSAGSGTLKTGASPGGTSTAGVVATAADADTDYTDADLGGRVALVLGNGCREVCSLELARSILDETGGLPGLVVVGRPLPLEPDLRPMVAAVFARLHLETG